MEFDGTVGACLGGSLSELWVAIGPVVRRPRDKRRAVDASSVSFEFFPNVRARRSNHFGLFGFAISKVVDSNLCKMIYCAVLCCAMLKEDGRIYEMTDPSPAEAAA
jgi:hypothetical protein